MTVAAHLLRTVGLVGALAAGAIGIVLLLPAAAALGVLLVGVGVVAVVTGRRHPGWAPVAERVAGHPWTSESGTRHETVVERALVDAAVWGGVTAIRSRVLRISVYREGRRRPLRRVAVGEDARWLGCHGKRLWFHVADGYHAGRAGLLGYDLRTAAVTFHQPGDPVEMAELRAPASVEGGPPSRARRSRRDRRPVMAVGGPGGAVLVDLARGEVIPPGAD